MKNILLLSVAIISLFSACGSADIKEEHLGHWATKAYMNKIDEGTNPMMIEDQLSELVLNDDSTYSYFIIGKKSKSGKYIPFKKNHFVIRDFFGINRDADLHFSKKGLLIENAFMLDKLEMKKISSEEFNKEEVKKIISYSMAYINKKTISGEYSSDQGNVSISEMGHVKGLKDVQYFSICLHPECRVNAKSNTMFIADFKNVGEYYEYEIKPDSLIIYNMDKSTRFTNMPSRRIGIQYALKKLN